MKNFYMVLCESTGYTKYKHENYESAKQEAVRLARQNPDHDFLVLSALATVKKNDIVIDEVLNDDIPF